MTNTVKMCRNQQSTWIWVHLSGQLCRSWRCLSPLAAWYWLPFGQGLPPLQQLSLCHFHFQSVPMAAYINLLTGQIQVLAQVSFDGAGGDPWENNCSQWRVKPLQQPRGKLFKSCTFWHFGKPIVFSEEGWGGLKSKTCSSSPWGTKQIPTGLLKYCLPLLPLFLGRDWVRSFRLHVIWWCSLGCPADSLASSKVSTTVNTSLYHYIFLLSWICLCSVFSLATL